MRLWVGVAVIAMLGMSSMAAGAACPARPSPPACLAKTAPFAPAEQVDCVGKAQRYFALADKYLECLRKEEARVRAQSDEARARLVCRSTTKRPC